MAWMMLRAGTFTSEGKRRAPARLLALGRFDLLGQLVGMAVRVPRTIR
jgi:hypothetical protein